MYKTSFCNYFLENENRVIYFGTIPGWYENKLWHRFAVFTGNNGTAEIITEDYSILQCILFPIKSLIKNNGPAFFNKTDRLESYFHHTI